MKFILRLQDVPELKSLTTAQRAFVHRVCYQTHGAGSWKTAVALMLYGLCGGFGVLGGKLLFTKYGLPFLVALPLGTLIGAAVGFVLYRTILLTQLRPYYADFIKNELPKLEHDGRA